MKILSFDVGIKNLAYCIINDEKIHAWEIINIETNAKFSAHISTSGVSELYINLIKKLDERPSLLDVDIVLIEKQPSFNPKMRIIAGCLQTYFYIRGVVDRLENKIKSVEFFSPKNKLKCYTGPEIDISSKNGKIVKGKYAQTKKTGVIIARGKLEENNETDFKILFENSKKKDDLSDCYLQALTYTTFKQPKPQVIVKQTKGLFKKQLKEFLDNRVKLCTVMELMEKDYIKLDDILLELPEKLKLELDKYKSQEEMLKSLSLKKYKGLSYKKII